MTDAAILTAAHVLAGAAPESMDVTLDVGGEGECSPQLLDCWADESGTDLAVISIRPRDREEIQPVPMGQLSRDRDAVLTCITVGFPRWKLRNEDQFGPFRDLHQANGTIASLSNRREGTLEVTLPWEPDRDPDPQRSPWEGMSGAAVVVEERVVGVVAEHHRREGLAHLSARPLSAAYTMLSRDELARLSRLIQLPARLNELIDVVPAPSIPAGLERALLVARELVPADLSGRSDELAALTRFCAGNDHYLRLEGSPWAGKTAVMAHFVTHPPAGTVVASCFIRGTDPERSDSAYFLQTVNEQLAAITGLVDDRSADPGADFLRLLGAAAETCLQRRQRLVLVVDGLDEDASARRGKSVIGALLPWRPPAPLRVIVTSRPSVDLPRSLSHDHPLRTVVPLQLSPLKKVFDLQRRASDELEAQAREREPREILRYVTASGAGLAAVDVASLAGMDRLDVERIVSEGLGRTIRCSPRNGRRCGYEFVHQTLLVAAQSVFDEDLDEYERRIGNWAAGWGEKGWPGDTPEYLIGAYSRALEDRKDAAALSRLATDRARHELLYRRTQTDAAALEEVQSAHLLWCQREAIDMSAVAALTGWREVLLARNRHIPVEVARAWARLGQIDRAEAMARLISAEALAEVATSIAADDLERAESIARSIADPIVEAAALASIARLVPETDPKHSRQLVDDAERVALSIHGDPDSQCAAIAAVARAIATTFPDRAYRLIKTYRSLLSQDFLSFLSFAWHKNEALADAMTALALIDIDRAERIARSWRNPIERLSSLDQAVALGAVARAVATQDPERARQLAEESERANPDAAFVDVVVTIATIETDRAEEIAGSIVDVPVYGAKAALDVAGVIAVTDSNRGERIARLIGDPTAQAAALAEVAGAIAATDPDHARRLTEDAERLIRREPGGDGLSFGEALRLIASSDPDRAEAIARAMDPSWIEARALYAVAATIAVKDPGRALRLAEDSERLAKVSQDIWAKSRARAVIAIAVAATDADQAEAIASSIDDNDVQGNAIARVAAVVASTDPGRAESIARSLNWDIARSFALANVAAVVVTGNPQRAEGIARSIEDPSFRAKATAALAADIATDQPEWAHRVADESEAVARRIDDSSSRAEALAEIAAEIAAFDPDRARRLAEESERLAWSLEPYDQSDALEKLAKTMATIDPKQAETISRSIDGPVAQSRALAATAEGLLGTDPDRARHLVCEGLRTSEWASFLSPLALFSPVAVVRLAEILAGSESRY